MIRHMPLPRNLVAQSIKDEYTPHDPPFNWYAMGDSYTAGPGAGDLHESNKGDCVRSVGSYGPQLQDDWLYDSDNVMTFLACTGDITDQMIKNKLPEVSSDPAPDLAIFTIGGNDIGFAEIAKSCLVGQLGKPKCDDLIQACVPTDSPEPFVLCAKHEITGQGIRLAVTISRISSRRSMTGSSDE
ncbi:hypothetical protein OEA41_001942 [Lepraria neglecta]|uniref:SGNH hydrolase-type esterase domain-containing protein n=1 Tax=Lepraria neglecta TaxID=209136 RepID=A0AAD9ZAL0_9LECA|nr:hypothetical protein OEA41_001942 [Lepraria neglecta]